MLMGLLRSSISPPRRNLLAPYKEEVGKLQRGAVGHSASLVPLSGGEYQVSPDSCSQP